MRGILSRHGGYETHKTFEDYCRDRWDMKRSTAYQMIDSYSVVENVRNCGQNIPFNESQARPLTKLEPEQQVQEDVYKNLDAYDKEIEEENKEVEDTAQPVRQPPKKHSDIGREAKAEASKTNRGSVERMDRPILEQQAQEKVLHCTSGISGC